MVLYYYYILYMITLVEKKGFWKKEIPKLLPDIIS